MMDESFDSVLLSPTRLLARLQELRSLQEAARDKLQYQRRLCGSTSTEASDSIQEVLAHLSRDSSSYRTFQNLLQDSHEDTHNSRSSQHSDDLSRRSSQKIRSQDLIDGVSVLNLSQESEPVLGSPSSGKSKISNKSDGKCSKTVENAHLKDNKPTNSTIKKHIELEETPILSPRRDFESLLLEKMEMEKVCKEKASKPVSAKLVKKPFLRRGDGLSRFGVKKDDLVIQNTKSLPWKRRSLNNSQRPNSTHSDPCGSNSASQSSLKCKDTISETVKEHKSNSSNQPSHHKVVFSMPAKNAPVPISESNKEIEKPIELNDQPQKTTPAPKQTKTWAALLTQEQDTFLRQLKQSSYYKNFESPAKSLASEDTCFDESLRREKEAAEQNMFELLEHKVSNASFCSESSFFHKFFRSKADDSGDNTPLMLQRCLTTNPQLLQLFPQPAPSRGDDDCSGLVEEKSAEHNCESEYVDCDHETCSSTSSCCTCRTVEESSTSVLTSTPHVEGEGKQGNKQPVKFKNKHEKENTTLDQTVTATDEVKANMLEMNAKLTATSELLKERLHELEDEIEMFRQENAALAKTREEIDVEKQRFYDEKSAYEQKFNEDKVLSEYYLAEEKEKLAKQKQVYDRYVREMRGRLNRKEKDEVAKLKKEIEGLKEEFRNKDAKSTSCIARLRNQLKIVEKEKKDLQDECEKLKKENRRIQQINTTTRRLSNIKYLAEINKKLALIGNNDKMPKVLADNDVQYKMSEMETRGRAKKLLPTVNRQLRVRAKSVPNLTVTSRYAKYFSQRDAISQMERERVVGEDFVDGGSVHSDYSSDIDYNTLRNYENSLSNASKNRLDSDHKNAEINCSDEDNLERIYSQTFQNTSDVAGHEASGISARSIKSLGSHSGRQLLTSRTKSPISAYNLCASESSYSHTSKSPIPPLNLSRSGSSNTLSRSKSPISILSNRSSMGSRKSFIENSPSNDETPPDSLRRQLNDDNNSRTSLTRTNLSPTEIKRPDGTRELRFPNGNVKVISGDGKTSKFIYYNGDIKETFHDEGKTKYYYAETKTYHTTHVDGLEVLQFPDGQVEKRYGDGSVEIRLTNGSVRYTDPRSEHVSEEWRFPDGAVLTVSRDGEQVVRFPNGQVEVHAADHKRREFPDGTVKLVYADGTSETRYASGRVRIKDRQGALIMDSAPSR